MAATRTWPSFDFPANNLTWELDPQLCGLWGNEEAFYPFAPAILNGEFDHQHVYLCGFVDIPIFVCIHVLPLDFFFFLITGPITFIKHLIDDLDLG